MASKIFINLPVKELDRTVAFYAALGYAFDARYTNENATCMIVADNILVMLLVEPFFATFTSKPISDARAATEVLLALSLDSREAVDALVARAVAAGARTPVAPVDHGFMYQHGYEDPDGHMWELFHMDGTPPQP